MTPLYIARAAEEVLYGKDAASLSTTKEVRPVAGLGAGSWAGLGRAELRWAGSKPAGGALWLICAVLATCQASERAPPTPHSLLQRLPFSLPFLLWVLHALPPLGSSRHAGGAGGGAGPVDCGRLQAAPCLPRHAGADQLPHGRAGRPNHAGGVVGPLMPWANGGGCCGIAPAAAAAADDSGPGTLPARDPSPGQWCV